MNITSGIRFGAVALVIVCGACTAPKGTGFTGIGDEPQVEPVEKPQYSYKPSPNETVHVTEYSDGVRIETYQFGAPPADG